MKRLTALLSFLFLVAVGPTSFAQEIGTDAKSPTVIPHSSQERKAFQKKEAQRIKAEKAIEKGKKKHLKMQTKEVRKRMKKSQKESERINGNKKKFFLVRWFSKKQR